MMSLQADVSFRRCQKMPEVKVDSNYLSFLSRKVFQNFGAQDQIIRAGGDTDPSLPWPIQHHAGNESSMEKPLGRIWMKTAWCMSDNPSRTARKVMRAGWLECALSFFKFLTPSIPMGHCSPPCTTVSFKGFLPPKMAQQSNGILRTNHAGSVDPEWSSRVFFFCTCAVHWKRLWKRNERAQLFSRGWSRRRHLAA